MPLGNRMTFVESTLVELPCHSNPDARILGQSHEPQNSSPGYLGARRNPFLHWTRMVCALWAGLAELSRSHNHRYRRYLWYTAVFDRSRCCNFHQLLVGVAHLQTSCSQCRSWINDRTNLLVWVSVCPIRSHLSVLGV